MLSITLHDLRFRARQIVIAVVGAGLVFGMALLLTGLADSFRAEVARTVDSVGADAWVVPAGSTGPFTSVGALSAEVVDEVRSLAGVEVADPLLIVPQTAVIDGEVRSLRLFGHLLGGLGTPVVSDGRGVERPREVVVDDRTGLSLGDRLQMGDDELVVVGRVHGHTLLGGVPNAYASLGDTQRIALGGLTVINTVVARGDAAGVAPGLRVLTSAAVRADTVHAMRDAIASIDGLRMLMWVVAAIIVAALMYVSSLERSRDFAVLKSLGSSSWSLFLGVAVQAVIVTLLAALLAVGAAWLLRPMFALPTVVPARAYLALPVVAIGVGLVSSLVALRRATSVDPAAAFSGAT